MTEFLRVATIPVTVLLAFVLFLLLTRGRRLAPRLAREGFNLRSWLTGVVRDRSGSVVPPARGGGLVMAVRHDKDGNRTVEVSETTRFDHIFSDSPRKGSA